MALEWLPLTCVAGRGNRYSSGVKMYHANCGRRILVPFYEHTGGWESADVLRKHAEWTVVHMTATLEGSRDLIEICVVTLKTYKTIAMTAPPEITMLVEANSFPVAVSTMEYEGSHERSKWAHRYITVVFELVQVAEQQFPTTM